MTLETMFGQRLAIALEPLLHTPEPDYEAVSAVDDVGLLDDVEAPALEPPPARSPGWLPGMALCIPTLSLIGLLYTLLK